MAWTLDRGRCIRCGGCVAVCPFQALELVNYPEVDGRCTGCKICEATCPVRAIRVDK